MIDVGVVTVAVVRLLDGMMLIRLSAEHREDALYEWCCVVSMPDGGCLFYA